jgi:hypothetical protein
MLLRSQMIGVGVRDSSSIDPNDLPPTYHLAAKFRLATGRRPDLSDAAVFESDLRVDHQAFLFRNEGASISSEYFSPM